MLVSNIQVFRLLFLVNLRTKVVQIVSRYIVNTDSYLCVALDLAKENSECVEHLHYRVYLYRCKRTSPLLDSILSFLGAEGFYFQYYGILYLIGTQPASQ